MDLDDYGAQLAGRLNSLLDTIEHAARVRIQRPAKVRWNPAAMGIPVGPINDTWREDAACRGSYAESFWPDIDNKQTHIRSRMIETAIETCKACPVQTDCLRFAVESNQRYGIWAGTTYDERSKLRKEWLASA